MKRIPLLLSMAALVGFGSCGGIVHAQTDANTTPATVTPAPAHPTLTSDERVSYRLKELTQKLALTEDQQTQIKPILLRESQKAMVLRNDSSVTEADKYTQMKAIRDEYKPKIEAVLTPDQRAIFESLKESRHWTDNGVQDVVPASNQ